MATVKFYDEYNRLFSRSFGTDVDAARNFYRALIGGSLSYGCIYARFAVTGNDGAIVLGEYRA